MRTFKLRATRFFQWVRINVDHSPIRDNTNPPNPRSAGLSVAWAAVYRRNRKKNVGDRLSCAGLRTRYSSSMDLSCLDGLPVYQERAAG